MKTHLRRATGGVTDWTMCGRWVRKADVVKSPRDATCLTCRRLVLGVADYHLPDTEGES